jgi:hypothetical protein
MKQSYIEFYREAVSFKYNYLVIGYQENKMTFISNFLFFNNINVKYISLK